MAKYVHKTDDVEAVKLDGATGDLRVDDDTLATAGDWLVKHSAGRWSVLTDAHFAEHYEPAPEPPATPETAPEPDPVAETPPAPDGQPEVVA